MANGGGGAGVCHPSQQLSHTDGQWGEGGGWMPPLPTAFSEMGRAFLQTKFLPVGSSLGHLSMKKLFRSDLPSWL